MHSGWAPWIPEQTLGASLLEMFLALSTGLIRPQKGSVTNRKHEVLLSQKKQNSKSLKLLEVALIEASGSLPAASLCSRLL